MGRRFRGSRERVPQPRVHLRDGIDARSTLVAIDDDGYRQKRYTAYIRMPIPALSVLSNVMSIRRTDKHCGARLVAAPATLHIAPLLFSSLLCPAFRLPTLPSASLPLALSPSAPIPLCLPTRLCAATYNHFTPPRIFPLYTGPYTVPTPLHHRHRHHYRQPSLLLSNSIRGASALASSDSVVTRRAGILRFHQLPLLPAD